MNPVIQPQQLQYSDDVGPVRSEELYRRSWNKTDLINLSALKYFRELTASEYFAAN